MPEAERWGAVKGNHLDAGNLDAVDERQKDGLQVKRTSLMPGILMPRDERQKDGLHLKGTSLMPTDTDGLLI